MIVVRPLSHCHSRRQREDTVWLRRIEVVVWRPRTGGDNERRRQVVEHVIVERRLNCLARVEIQWILARPDVHVRKIDHDRCRFTRRNRLRRHYVTSRCNELSRHSRAQRNNDRESAGWRVGSDGKTEPHGLTHLEGVSLSALETFDRHSCESDCTRTAPVLRIVDSCLTIDAQVTQPLIVYCERRVGRSVCYHASMIEQHATTAELPDGLR